MLSFPNRCQHIKVNGTLCASPALRRNRFCYFHKRHHEERVLLNADRAKQRRKVSLTLPVLEDANSIQVSLMQIMRLLLVGQIDGKTAGLLLYALQTASANLGRVGFEPYRHDVVLDPRTVGEIPLGSSIWEDSDFSDEDEEDEDDEGARRVAAVEEGRRIARKHEENRRWAEAEGERIIEEGNRKREAAREAARAAAIRYAAEVKRLDAQREATQAALKAEAEPTATAVTKTASPATNVPAAAVTPAGRAVVPTAPPEPGKRPPANVSLSDARKQIRAQVLEALPDLAAALAEKQHDKGRSG
jgi:hypothetical protein